MNFIQTQSFKLATISAGDPKATMLALLLPGRLDTKDYPHMKSHIEFLAKRGYFAVSFDPPGTWDSPGGIDLYTTVNYLKAINELIEHFGNKPTLLMGHSRGGSMAMLAGTTNPNVTEIISVMSHTFPSTPHPDAEKTGFHISHRDLPDNPNEKKKFLLPYNYFVEGNKYNMRKNIEVSTKPKLFFYGIDDILVTPAEVQEDFAAAAEPKQLHKLNCDHNYRWHPAMIDEVNQVVGEFLDTYALQNNV